VPLVALDSEDRPCSVTGNLQSSSVPVTGARSATHQATGLRGKGQVHTAMAEFSTVIKGGTVFDGQRTPRVRTDIGIKGGIITAIGQLDAADADEVIDATGLNVAPGFIDNHTHYDSQLFWDPYCSISGWHGVTSVVIGNCGFSFAPVKPEDRERAMLSMTRNEAIPLSCMQDGMPWDWVTFPEFLDSVDRTPKSVNVLPYMGIAPMMTWVMGLDEAKSGRMPTDAEHAEMRRLLNEAMDAGACGWSTQISTGWAGIQLDYDGTPMVTDIMNNETCIELAKVLAERREGTIEATVNTDDTMGDRAQVESWAEASGRPVVWNAVFIYSEDAGVHRNMLDWLKSCRERGLQVIGQGITSDAPTIFTLEDWNLWDNVTEWREALMGTYEERLANVKERRELLKACPPKPQGTGLIEKLLLVETFTPEYKQYEGKTFGHIIEATGRDRMDVFLDIVIADELKTVILSDPLKAPDSSWQELIEDPFLMPGQSDGGAHTKFITFGRYPTEYLTRFVRDNNWISLEEAHWRLSAYPALASGFKNRGILVEGAPADIVIYDLENLEILPQEVAHDYPGGEWRRIQRAKGYRYVLVNGEVTIKDDQETGVASGQLLRWGGDPERLKAARLTAAR
jgi:N-acyl-D-amino-acid deacylase